MNGLRHLARAIRHVLRDGRVPRPLRAVGAFGLLPIPGPVDEVALILAAVCLAAFYRAPLRSAWKATA